MNGEKPKPRTWEDIVKESTESIKIAEMNLAIAKVVLAEAKTHIKKK